MIKNIKYNRKFARSEWRKSLGDNFINRNYIKPFRAVSGRDIYDKPKD